MCVGAQKLLRIALPFLNLLLHECEALAGRFQFSPIDNLYSPAGLGAATFLLQLGNDFDRDGARSCNSRLRRYGVDGRAPLLSSCPIPPSPATMKKMISPSRSRASRPTTSSTKLSSKAMTNCCATPHVSATIPGVIVQGRYDVVCPMESAWSLHRAWPEADFIITPDSGHSAFDPPNTRALVAATDKLSG
jgi:pimeloyl-ACP methyl ester carboxylesterase